MCEHFFTRQQVEGYGEAFLKRLNEMPQFAPGGILGPEPDDDE